MELIVQYAPLLLALVAAGIAAGLAAGLFGIGGGAIIVPVLYFLFEGSSYLIKVDRQCIMGKVKHPHQRMYLILFEFLLVF